MLCVVNFTTANIYNFHKHTLTCDLKNYMTRKKNNRRVPVEKVFYWLSKYDWNRCCRISDKLWMWYQNMLLRCFVKVLCLLTDSKNMLRLKGKTARDIYSWRFGIDGRSRSSLEVLKTDRTLEYHCSFSQKLRWTMVKTENWMSFIVFLYSNTLLAISSKSARNIDL